MTSTLEDKLDGKHVIEHDGFNETTSAETTPTSYSFSISPIRLREGCTVPPITDSEYANLDALMTQFCRVPLIKKFPRPVLLLHPELDPLYSKVVKDPIDLVCRAIHRRQYRDTRQVCIDMRRIFSNCVKFHTHQGTRKGPNPIFVSVANHLREYFDSLWMEYMIPSEVADSNGNSKKMTKGATLAMQTVESTRIVIRKERVNALASTVLSAECLRGTSTAIEKFITLGGKVDALDVEPIIDNEEDRDVVQAVFSALSTLSSKLNEISHSQLEFTVEAINTELKGCYAITDLKGNAPLEKAFESRINRMLGQILAPVFEVRWRGVRRSSVWGCISAAIWARDQSRRPYWPSLVLGILAPDDLKEDWHKMLTDRNEARLPENLKQGLQAGKKKAEQALRRQATCGAERMSFFLVEFLGTHDFLWVKEADIIDPFDPDKDPNRQDETSSKRKKSSRNQTPQNTRKFQLAIQEGKWAIEEFKMQLNDPCGDKSPEDEGEEEEQEENCSYAMLCEMDDTMIGAALPERSGIDLGSYSSILPDSSDDHYNPEVILWRSDPRKNFSDWKVEIQSKVRIDRETEGTNTDVYHVHLSYLCTGIHHSEYFCAKFDKMRDSTSKLWKQSRSRFELKPSAALVFPLVLDYIYTGSCSVTHGNAVALRFLSNYFSIPTLYTRTHNFIRSSLDVRTALKYYGDAVHFDDEKLKVAASDTIAENLDTLSRNELSSFPPEFFSSILTSKNRQISGKDLSKIVCDYWRDHAEQNTPGFTAKFIATVTHSKILTSIHPSVAIQFLKLCFDNRSLPLNVKGSIRSRCIEATRNDWMEIFGNGITKDVNGNFTLYSELPVDVRIELAEIALDSAVKEKKSSTIRNDKKRMRSVNGADDNNVNDNLTDDNVTVCTDDNVTGDDDSDDDSTRLWAKKIMISRPDTVPS